MTKTKNKQSKGHSHNDESMVVYKGPISSGSSQPQTLRVVLRSVAAATAASAGYIEMYAHTGQATAMPEYSAYSGLWREYRVLGIKMQYRPWYDMGGYPGSAVVQSSGLVASYHGVLPSFQGAVTSSTEQALLQYDGVGFIHPGTPFTKEWRMQDIEEAQYFPVSTQYTLGGIYGYVPTATGSRRYGTYYVTFLIEFKGRI